MCRLFARSTERSIIRRSNRVLCWSNFHSVRKFNVHQNASFVIFPAWSFLTKKQKLMAVWRHCVLPCIYSDTRGNSPISASVQRSANSVPILVNALSLRFVTIFCRRDAKTNHPTSSKRAWLFQLTFKDLPILRNINKSYSTLVIGTLRNNQKKKKGILNTNWTRPCYYCLYSLGLIRRTR